MTLEEIVDLKKFLAAIEDDIFRAAGAEGLHDIKPSFIHIAAMIHLGSTRATVIGKELGTTSQGVSKIISDMKKRGYLTLDQDQDDARFRDAILTERGKKIVEIYDQVANIWMY